MIDKEPTADGVESAGGGTGARGVLSALAIVALIAAIVCAGWFGYRGYQAVFVDKPVQTARDDSLAAAEQAILNVTTVDTKDVTAWRKRIDESLTGKAHDQASTQAFDSLNQDIKNAGSPDSSLTSRLVRSAPTEVDASENTAKALVYVAVTTKQPNTASVTQTMGFSVSMQKVGGTWKASDIVPLNTVAYDQGATAPNGATPGATTPNGATQGGGN